MPAVTRLLALSLGLSVFGSVPFFGHAQSQKNEDIDYFGKWLKEDVVYIITNEEVLEGRLRPAYHDGGEGAVHRTVLGKAG